MRLAAYALLGIVFFDLSPVLAAAPVVGRVEFRLTRPSRSAEIALVDGSPALGSAEKARATLVQDAIRRMDRMYGETFLLPVSVQVTLDERGMDMYATEGQASLNLFSVFGHPFALKYTAPPSTTIAAWEHEYAHLVFWEYLQTVDELSEDIRAFASYFSLQAKQSSEIPLTLDEQAELDHLESGQNPESRRLSALSALTEVFADLSAVSAEDDPKVFRTLLESVPSEVEFPPMGHAVDPAFISAATTWRLAVAEARDYSLPKSAAQWSARPRDHLSPSEIHVVPAEFLDRGDDHISLAPAGAQIWNEFLAGATPNERRRVLAEYLQVSRTALLEMRREPTRSSWTVTRSRNEKLVLAMRMSLNLEHPPIRTCGHLLEDALLRHGRQ